MVRFSSKVTGKAKTEAMIKSGLLGSNVNRNSLASISHYTTAYRQEIVFNEMKKIVLDYLSIWYI
jgi:hypothetical protein